MKINNSSSIYNVVFKLIIKHRELSGLVEIKSVMDKYIHFTMKTQQDVDSIKNNIKEYHTEEYPVLITTAVEYWTSRFANVRHIIDSHQDLSNEIFTNMNIRATELVLGKFLLVIAKNEEGKHYVEGLYKNGLYDGHPLEINIIKRPTLFGTYRNINWKSYGLTEDGIIACDLCEGKKKVYHFDGCPGCSSSGYLFDCLKHNAEHESFQHKKYKRDYEYMVDFLKKNSNCLTCKGDSNNTFGGSPCKECGLIGIQPCGS